MGYKILIVDDENEILNTMKKSFEFAKFEVSICNNMNDAVKDLETNKYDVLLTDIRMPGGSGVDLLKSIQTFKEKPKCIAVMSGFSDTTKEEVLSLGATFFIQKPFIVRKLAAQIISEMESK